MDTTNREERRLMRQRGAGTRKIQEVDFGFSFGTPTVPPARPARRIPQPDPSSSASRRSSRRGPTPETHQRTPQHPQTKLRTPSTRQSSARRSPGSSTRNRNPSGSAVYDIPPDPPASQSGSAKRRKIGPKSKTSSIQTIPENSPLKPNGIGADAIDKSHTSQHVEHSDPSQLFDLQKSTVLSETTESYNRSKAQTPQQSDPNSTLSSLNKGNSSPTRQGNTYDQNETPAQATELNAANSSSKPGASKSGKRPKKRKSVVHWTTKGRRSSDEANRRRSQEEAQTIEAAEPELPEQPQPNPVQKGRKPKSIGQQPEAEKTAPETVEEGDSGVAEAVEINETVAEQVESTEPKKRRRKSVLQKKRKARLPNPPSREEQPEDENNVDDDAQTAEQENINESPPISPEPSQSKGRKGRKSTGQGPAKRRRQLETVQEEPEPEAEEEASPQQATLRKPKESRPPKSQTEPRKNSVPVTVHRLANLSALDALSDSDASSNEPDSSDELATRHKFPNRAGVNPADVLSQICRETLGKTLSALENGIANETQPARRAEWTRKRKAVEAFSAELEGRLFDMSEVLDSNFALAMGLKRAKKDMMESRSKLMDIRRQREEIALKTDEVRRKHSEEERTQTQHNAVNNSLHSLELAIDRDQSRAQSPDLNNPSAGLEFLLRSVADDVSSTAPGSQGGLLNQIKNFNAHLEERVKGGGRI